MQAIVISVLNVGLALAVFYASGHFSHKTIYDKYIVRFEGASIPVRDLQRSLQFYSTIMDFAGLPVSAEDQQNGVRGIQVPERRRILLELRHQGQDDEHDGGLIVIRVRNGFTKLHEELLHRMEALHPGVQEGSSPAIAGPERITAIFEGQRGREFVITDPDNNQLLFYTPRRFGF